MTHPNDDIDIEFQPEPDRLYAHNRRQLSAMLDGELSPDQARFMLRRLQHDTALAACWERWQGCGDVLRGRGIGVDDLLRADLVGVLIVLQVVIRHEWGRIVHAPNLAFLTDLDLGNDRVDG